MTQRSRRHRPRSLALVIGLLLVAVLAGSALVGDVDPPGTDTAAQVDPTSQTGGADASGAAADRTAAATWVSGWQGSPTAGEGSDHAACPADTGLDDQTVRNIVPVSTGGGQVRVRLSNAFGAKPLQVGAASVGIAGPGASIQPGPLLPLLFGGQPSVLVAAGAEAVSDPVPLTVQPLQRLAVSVYLPGRTGPATQHDNSREINYLASADRTADPAADPFGPIGCWMFASGVDVLAPARVAGTVVTLGDSLTDGERSTPGAGQRYPDWLARRLLSLSGTTLSVSNAGISGNEVLYDRDPALAGVAAPARLGRDVLGQAGVRSVILLEGTNDIGDRGATAQQLVQVYQQIAAQVHAAGLPVYIGTLPPFGGSNAAYGGDYGSVAGQQQRSAVNDWIRTQQVFDGVIDFDAALRDPAAPDQLMPLYDSGDHLHPSDAGYRRMAEAVDLPQLVAASTRG